MNCKKCGTPASPGDNFCENCGMPLHAQEKNVTLVKETTKEHEIIEVSIPPSELSKADEQNSNFNQVSNWYYAISEQQQGPVSKQDMVSLVKTGAVKPDTLVWNGGSDWVRADKTELSSLFVWVQPPPIPVLPPAKLPSPAEAPCIESEETGNKCSVCGNNLSLADIYGQGDNPKCPDCLKKTKQSTSLPVSIQDKLVKSFDERNKVSFVEPTKNQEFSSTTDSINTPYWLHWIRCSVAIAVFVFVWLASAAGENSVGNKYNNRYAIGIIANEIDLENYWSEASAFIILIPLLFSWLPALMSFKMYNEKDKLKKGFYIFGFIVSIIIFFWLIIRLLIED